jgi:predicted ferric reductase
MATILLFAAAHFFNLWASDSIRTRKVVRTPTAIARFLSYRAYRVPGLNWSSAPLGILLLGAVGMIYFFCMTLGPKPFYWPTTATLKFGNSPPIATRSGWLSLACFPFIFATAGKSNLITAITGVSHEKLQVFHRWISYACFVSALIHTFPFIIYNIQQGQMEKKWNTSVVYWTGVVAIVAQAWLTFASFAPIR